MLKILLIVLFIYEYLQKSDVYYTKHISSKGIVEMFKKLNISLKKFQSFYESKYYSTYKLKVIEILCLKLIDYYLNFPTPLFFVKLYIIKGCIKPSSGLSLFFGSHSKHLLIKSIKLSKKIKFARGLLSVLILLYIFK